MIAQCVFIIDYPDMSYVIVLGAFAAMLLGRFLLRGGGVTRLHSICTETLPGE